MMFIPALRGSKVDQSTFGSLEVGKNTIREFVVAELPAPEFVPVLANGVIVGCPICDV